MENPRYEDYVAAGGVTTGCTNRALAYAFFTSYYFIVALIFLQLFIAVILQGYDDTQVQEARLFNNEMNITFREKWADFDPDATTFIDIYQLRDFLTSIGSPLGFDHAH
jgi:Voltage-dependent L-type calcium channel, IQ-associated